MRRIAGLALLVLMASASAAHAAPCGQRLRTPPFESAWQALDGVRQWRAGFSQRTGDLTVPHNKSYRQMLEDYVGLPRIGGGSDPARVPPTALQTLLEKFDAALDDPATECQAGNGLQETIGELMMGQLLAGNDRLLRGLRIRYPKTGDDPAYDKNDPVRLLRESVAIFQAGIDPAVRRLREAPGGLRAGSHVNPAFAVWVENTPRSAGGTGELVENDLYQLTQLVLRRGIAETSYGRRTFFLGNDQPTKREEAARIVKRAGYATYLHSAVLAAVQEPHDFQQNFGTELRGVIGDAQNLFDDIRKGVNPLRQRGDFVPDASLANLISNARTTWTSAKGDEERVKEHRRLYDEDYSALEQELATQQEGSLKKVYDEIGLTIDVGNPVWTLCDALDLAKAPDDDPRRAGCQDEAYDLRTEEGQQATLLLAWDQRSGNDPAAFVEDMLTCDADICVAHQEWVQAGLDVQRTQDQIKELNGQIAVEDERNGTISNIIYTDGLKHLAIDIAHVVASGFPDVAYQHGTTNTVTTNWKPADVANAALDIGSNWLDVLKEQAIENAEHEATVKNLHLQMAGLLTEVKQAEQARTVARNRYTALVGDLQWVLAGFARAQNRLAKLYFTNPAYRMQLDDAELNADLSFESAVIQAYLLAKRLEYEWGEHLRNPVKLVGGGDAPIGGSAKYSPVTTAESAFAVASVAGGDAPELSLRTYLEALQFWDAELRNDPRRPTGETSTKTFSLKSDILGIVGDAEFTRLAFRRFVATHRVPGRSAAQQDLVIEFGVQIDGQQLFPYVPNLRIESIEMDLRGAPGRAVRGPGALNPPEVELVLGGQATIRSFAAVPPDDDRTMVFDLERPDELALQQSQFYTIVAAKVDGTGTPRAATGLDGRSPAATRWLLRIDMDKGANRDLRLENLDDILITFTTRWGEPRRFPEIFPTG